VAAGVVIGPQRLTAGANDVIVVYKPTDALLGYLAAFEAGNSEANAPRNAF
jgi:hypothetical protein